MKLVAFKFFTSDLKIALKNRSAHFNSIWLQVIRMGNTIFEKNKAWSLKKGPLYILADKNITHLSIWLERVRLRIELGLFLGILDASCYRRASRIPGNTRNVWKGRPISSKMCPTLQNFLKMFRETFTKKFINFVFFHFKNCQNTQSLRNEIHAIKFFEN